MVAQAPVLLHNPCIISHAPRNLVVARRSHTCLALSDRKSTSGEHKSTRRGGAARPSGARGPPLPDIPPPAQGGHTPPAQRRSKTGHGGFSVVQNTVKEHVHIGNEVQTLSSQDTWWISMLVFRVLLITLTLGYGGIGLVWELQGVDVQHLTAWDKASAAVVVETVQLLLVWVLISRAAEEKQTTAYGGILNFQWSLDAIYQGGAGAAGAFALNAGLTIALTIAVAVVVAIVSTLGDGGGSGGVVGEAVQGVVAVRHVSNAHDAEIASIVASSNTAAATGMLIASGFLAPLVEEIVYRGILLPALLPRMSTTSAVGVSAVVFAASHASLARFWPLLCLGVVLGVLRVRAGGGNLVPCVVAHAVHNLVVLTAMMMSSGPW